MQDCCSDTPSHTTYMDTRCIFLIVQAHNGCIGDRCGELEQAQVILQRLETEIWAAYRELDRRLGDVRIVGLQRGVQR